MIPHSAPRHFHFPPAGKCERRAALRTSGNFITPASHCDLKPRLRWWKKYPCQHICYCLSEICDRLNMQSTAAFFLHFSTQVFQWLSKTDLKPQWTWRWRKRRRGVRFARRENRISHPPFINSIPAAERTFSAMRSCKFQRPLLWLDGLEFVLSKMSRELNIKAFF